MVESLLPLNATAVEKAVDQLAADKLAIDLTPIDTNPMTCPENLLPWLAASWRIDIAGLSLDEKRRLVAKALEIHRYKGTVYAVKQALEAVFDDVDIIEFKQPFIFDAKVTLKADPSAVYDAGKFSLARALANRAKNLRSRFGVFDINMPDARLPLYVSAVANVNAHLSTALAMASHAKAQVTGGLQVVVKPRSSLAMDSHTHVNVTGAMQWTI